MDKDALTLDQMRVFVAVVETGSFSAASRKLNRAQSAITYVVQKLEEQVGADLFDRAAYRPSLSEAGRILLPQARRILDDITRFRASARQMTRGLEAELRLLISGAVPIKLLTPALTEFRDTFPSVQLRLMVQPFSMAIGRDAAGVSPGEGDVRILYDMMLPDVLDRFPIATIKLVTVAAATHPLVQAGPPLEADALQDKLQIVLSEVREAVAGEDRRVVALNIWRVTDPGVQYGLIVAGVGWGSLPDALVDDDLAAGRLVRLKLKDDSPFQRVQALPLIAAHRRDEPPGPAGRWLLDRLSASASSSI